MPKSLFDTKYFLITSLFTTTLMQPPLLLTHDIMEESETPPTEDLMHEHGILNRILLIYEEIIKRINTNADFPLSSLDKAAGIIKSFIEDHHEKVEEDYIFPLFEKSKTELRLVKTLKHQHTKGREITTKLRDTISAKALLTEEDKILIQGLLQNFITMYRPHEAREDTVLFPKVRSLISREEFEKLGETLETLEHQLFGRGGFELIVQEVTTIEKELGIYKLDQFTPLSTP